MEHLMAIFISPMQEERAGYRSGFPETFIAVGSHSGHGHREVKGSTLLSFFPGKGKNVSNDFRYLLSATWLFQNLFLSRRLTTFCIESLCGHAL